MANHLIIGLGGTGGKIIRELRKRIVEECGSLDPNNGTHLEYVYVDSDPKDLEDRSKWKVLGKSVHLGEAQKVSINGIKKEIIGNNAQYPGVNSFITPEDSELIHAHMGTLISTGIGGQRRRLGRLLVANNISGGGTGNNLVGTIEAAVNKLSRKSGNAGCTFHILAGLAGGTGSGTIIDTIAQIRKRYAYNDNVASDSDLRYKIRLFLYVPEMNLLTDGPDFKFYQANGYASLLELNAISVNKYAPTDVSGEIDHNTGKIRRLLRNDEAFQIAYLFTNINKEGGDKDLESTLPQTVADFIYQTVIVANTPGIIGRMGRLIASENAGSQPENDSAGMPSRSRRFMSFGISKVIFPENEIKEYVSYSFAAEAMKQLLYNHWSPGIGYNNRIADGVLATLESTTKEHSLKQKYRLLDTCLTAEEAIIVDNTTKNWKTYDFTFESNIERISKKVKEEKGLTNIAEWKDELKEKIKTYVNSGFRGVGVDVFFSEQKKTITRNVSFIRGLIEDDLFAEWVNSTTETRCLIQMKEFVNQLRTGLQNKISTFKTTQQKYNSELLKLKEELESADVTWGKVSARHLNPYPYSDYVELLCDFYTTNAKIMSLDFAKEFINRLCDDLNLLSTQINSLISKLKSFLDEAENQSSTRCVVGLADDPSSSVIKIYNPQRVRDLTASYKANEDIQSANISAVQAELNSYVNNGSPRTFQSIDAKLNFDTLLDGVFSLQAVSALQMTADNRPADKMVDVNILDKIFEKYDTVDGRESFIRDIVKRASVHLPVDPAELALAGTMAPQDMVEVALPLGKTDNQKAFRGQFQEEVGNVIVNLGFSDNDKPNQLITVCASSGIPLRLSSNLKRLKDRYEQLVSPQNPNYKLNKMQLHTETFSNELPSLFELTPTNIKEMSIKPLLKAFAIGVVQRIENPNTGQHDYAMNIPDSVLGDNWIPLGKSFLDCLDNLSNNLGNARTLYSQVESVMATNYVHNNKKIELRTALATLYQEKILRDVFRGNQADETCQKFRNAVLSIINELNIEE